MANTRRTQGEGSVYMRKDGRAAASAMYEGKRITKYGKTKTEAKQKLDAYLDDLNKGKVVIGPKQTVEQYLTHWLEDSQRLVLRPRSYARRVAAVKNQIIPSLGHVQLDKLTREQVQAFYADLVNRGYAPRTVGNVHMALHKALKEAVLHGILGRNVSDHVSLPRPSDYEGHVLTWEECKCLIEAAQGRRVWFFLVLAISTGARLGELLALRWSDIDTDAGTIYIHRSAGRVPYLRGFVENEAKTRAGKRKPRLPRFVLGLVDQQRAYVDSVRAKAGSTWQENDLVFPGLHGGYTDSTIMRKQFLRLLKKVGLPHMRIHDLRHSAATLLLASGVSPRVVQEILGHSSISITLGLYGHIVQEMQDMAVDVMDSRLGDNLS